MTNQAKIDFFKWLKEQPVAPYEVMFDDIPFTVQAAYVIEWFDSVGIYITTSIDYDRMLNYNRGFDYEIRVEGKTYIEWGEEAYCFNSRQEAIKQGIIKANEIYNSRT